MKSTKNKPIFTWTSVLMVGMLSLNILVGSMTLKEKGMSWDEPLFYDYAQSIGDAYSISARLDGTFDLSKAYGISPEEHKQYGPAYILLAQPIVRAAEWGLQLTAPDAWHLVNFMFFQIGGLFLFLLSQRWMKSWIALLTSAFYITQPLLWGHGFINPKDIPFSTFFILSVYWGLRLADSVNILPDHVQGIDSHTQKRFTLLKNAMLTSSIVISFTTGLVFIFHRWIVEWIENFVGLASTAPTTDFLGRIFHRFAPNADGREISPYVVKALLSFSQARIGLLVVAVFLVLITAFMIIKQKTAIRIFHEINQTKASPLLVALAGIFLGMTTSIRILGPLCGFLIITYLVLKHGHRSLGIILLYGTVALLVCYLTWPYLWDSPIQGFLAVMKHMSDNPVGVGLLYDSVPMNSLSLPFSYMPTYLALTLTEPVWPLFLIGVIFALRGIKINGQDWEPLVVLMGWFFIPFLYGLLRRPPMYDGIRHFLFILPGVFVIAGIGIQALTEVIRLKWVNYLLGVTLLLPGMLGIIHLHPYEYAYFNTFIGGIEGAFRKYDTDYWLLCYKDAIEFVNQNNPQNLPVFVLRNPTLARTYAAPDLHVEQFQREPDNTIPRSLLLLTTRSNSDLAYHSDAPVFYQNGLDGVIFCVIKSIK